MSVICHKSENIIILSFRQRRNPIDFNGFFISFHSILNDKNGIMNEYGHSINILRFKTGHRCLHRH